MKPKDASHNWTAIKGDLGSIRETGHRLKVGWSMDENSSHFQFRSTCQFHEVLFYSSHEALPCAFHVGLSLGFSWKYKVPWGVATGEFFCKTLLIYSLHSFFQFFASTSEVCSVTTIDDCGYSSPSLDVSKSHYTRIRIHHAVLYLQVNGSCSQTCDEKHPSLFETAPKNNYVRFKIVHSNVSERTSISCQSW